ncbi:MAG: preprotein translocase subunit SecG [Ignavibacteriae bacterium]|nr:preprotein translocase subunit SecG [Ignavibacteriota bacterium]
MYTIIILVILIISALMTVVILMQSSKGQGLSGAFGGAGGVGTMLGVRRAADVLSNATWILAAAFVVLIFAVNMFFLPTQGSQDSIFIEQVPMNAAQRQMQQPAPQQQQAAPQQQPAPQQPPQPNPQPAPAGN